MNEIYLVPNTCGVSENKENTEKTEKTEKTTLVLQLIINF